MGGDTGHEPGRAGCVVEIATDTYDAAATVDASLAYQVTPRWQVTVGGHNIFNTYPTPQFDTWTEQGGMTDSLQMRSDGAYFFAKLGFRF